RLGLPCVRCRLRRLDDLVRLVGGRGAVEHVSAGALGRTVAAWWLARDACVCRRFFRHARADRVPSRIDATCGGGHTNCDARALTRRAVREKKMADIKVVRKHHLTVAQAKKIAQKTADDLASEYDLESEWQGDTLRFTRSGVNGSMAVTGSEI